MGSGDDLKQLAVGGGDDMKQLARPMSAKHVNAAHLSMIAQMATVGGHRQVLLLDRPSTPAAGGDHRTYDLNRKRPAAATASPPSLGADVPAAAAAQPPLAALQRAAAGGAHHSIPDRHRHVAATVAARDGAPLRLGDEALLDCCGDAETCLLCYFCPCVLVGRTARFAGHSPWLCGGLWCLLPPCVGAVLRQSLARRLAQEPPHILWALFFNHLFCAPCSICQEGRLAKASRVYAEEGRAAKGGDLAPAALMER